MQDDPFARAVERAQAAEKAEQISKRQRRDERVSSGTRTLFRTHLTVFLAVNFLLIAIWYTTWKLNDGTDYPWFMWVLLGWGIGLAAHWSATRDHMTPRHRREQSVQPQPMVQQQPLAPVAPQPVAPVSVAPVAAPVPAPAPSKTDELVRLAELHKAGALTDDEFSAAKADLLG